MTRFIDKSKIRFTGKSFIDDNKEIYVKLSDVRQAIAQTPTADVEEVKHGYWIVVGRTEHGKSILKCSNCERVRKNHGRSNFCCDCGAKMDGGKAE